MTIDDLLKKTLLTSVERVDVFLDQRIGPKIASNRR